MSDYLSFICTLILSRMSFISSATQISYLPDKVIDFYMN